MVINYYLKTGLDCKLAAWVCYAGLNQTFGEQIHDNMSINTQYEMG
jgi:hypothetical protein